MKQATKAKLKAAQDWCESQDKSSEFMIAYMGDVAEVGHDTVIKYLIIEGGFKQSIANTFPTKRRQRNENSKTL